MASHRSLITSHYDAFASLYDRHMANDFAARVLPVLDRLLLGRLTPGAAVLDVCCGSGRVSAGLIARGFEVTAGGVCVGCDVRRSFGRHGR